MTIKKAFSSKQMLNFGREIRSCNCDGRGKFMNNLEHHNNILLGGNVVAALAYSCFNFLAPTQKYQKSIWNIACDAISH